MICRTMRSLSRISSAVPKAISMPLSKVRHVEAASVAVTVFTCSASSVERPSKMARALFTWPSAK